MLCMCVCFLGDAHFSEMWIKHTHVQVFVSGLIQVRVCNIDLHIDVQQVDNTIVVSSFMYICSLDWSKTHILFTLLLGLWAVVFNYHMDCCCNPQYIVDPPVPLVYHIEWALCCQSTWANTRVGIMVPTAAAAVIIIQACRGCNMPRCTLIMCSQACMWGQVGRCSPCNMHLSQAMMVWVIQHLSLEGHAVEVMSLKTIVTVHPAPRQKPDPSITAERGSQMADIPGMTRNPRSQGQARRKTRNAVPVMTRMLQHFLVPHIGTWVVKSCLDHLLRGPNSHTQRLTRLPSSRRCVPLSHWQGQLVG